VAEKRTEVSESADREILLTRVFDVLRRMVWEAWTGTLADYLWTRISTTANGGL
jgi:uncharacterized protein YndB with AHSA1/START domain